MKLPRKHQFFHHKQIGTTASVEDVVTVKEKPLRGQIALQQARLVASDAASTTVIVEDEPHPDIEVQQEAAVITLQASGTTAVIDNDNGTTDDQTANDEAAPLTAGDDQVSKNETRNDEATDNKTGDDEADDDEIDTSPCR